MPCRHLCASNRPMTSEAWLPGDLKNVRLVMNAGNTTGEKGFGLGVDGAIAIQIDMHGIVGEIRVVTETVSNVCRVRLPSNGDRTLELGATVIRDQPLLPQRLIGKHPGVIRAGQTSVWYQAGKGQPEPGGKKAAAF